METLTFRLDKDSRPLKGALDDDVFTIDWTDNQYSWIEARQYDSGMRQTIVKVLTGDDNKTSPLIPMDLTGVNPVLEGVLPDGKHRIFDSQNATMLDAAGGQFRYDWPAQAFAVAGSYKQIFFRLMKNGQSIATLEFRMDVMADKVISGLVASDYITPFNDLYNKLAAIVQNADGDMKKFKETWDTNLKAMVDKYGQDFNQLQTIITTLQNRVTDIASEVKANNVVTLPMLSKYAGCPVMLGTAHIELGKNAAGYPDLYPSVHAYIGKYGAGLGGAGTTPAGGSTTYDINVRAVRNSTTEIEVYVSPDNIVGFMSDFDMKDADASIGGSFAHIYSGIFTIEVEFKGATVKSFDVDSAFTAKLAG